jgi:hypothetical protein
MSRAHSSAPPASKAFSTPVPVIAQTRAPSVTGDGDDMFCLRSWRLPPPSGRCQTRRPLSRSTAHRCSVTASCERRSSATLRKTRPPATIGVDPENDGSASVQATLSVRDHLKGTFVSALRPLREGPRQLGQSCTATPATASTISRRAIIGPPLD